MGGDRMEEEWRPVEDYPGYEVSNTGKVRSHWNKTKKKGCWGGYERVYSDETHMLSASDDGNGYLKVFMVDKNGKRHCRKIHRMVAEEFIPRIDGCDTVDHIKSGPDGKLDNSVENLRWLSRRENIQKAYADGMCDSRIARSRKPIMIHDWCEETDIYVKSVREAADEIGIHYTSVSHALADERTMVRGRYTVREPDFDEFIYYNDPYWELEYDI